MARYLEGSNQSHGMSNTPEYNTWASMRHRCLNKKSPSYKYYGGRGIKVCGEWLNDFGAFYRDMGPRPEGMTLDRIDNDGDYTPENCRWATKAEQSNNKSNTVPREVWCGSRKLTKLAQENGVSYQCLKQRIKSGWPEDEAAMTPVGGWLARCQSSIIRRHCLGLDPL